MSAQVSEDVQREYRETLHAVYVEFDALLTRAQPNQVVLAGHGRGPEIAIAARALPSVPVTGWEMDPAATAWMRGTVERLGLTNVSLETRDASVTADVSRMQAGALLASFFCFHLIDENETVAGHWSQSVGFDEMWIVDWSSPHQSGPTTLPGWVQSDHLAWPLTLTNPLHPDTTGVFLSRWTASRPSA